MYKGNGTHHRKKYSAPLRTFKLKHFIPIEQSRLSIYKKGRVCRTGEMAPNVNCWVGRLFLYSADYTDGRADEDVTHDCAEDDGQKGDADQRWSPSDCSWPTLRTRPSLRSRLDSLNRQTRSS